MTRAAGSLPDLVPGLRPADRETVAQLLLAVLLDSTTELLATSEDEEAPESIGVPLPDSPSAEIANLTKLVNRRRGSQ